MPSQQGEQLRAQMKELMAPVAQSRVPLEMRRAQFEAVGTRTPLPGDVQVESVAVGPVRGDWIRTPESFSNRVVLYLHGGGFIIGSSAMYRNFAAALSRITGMSFFILDYRLAPEHPYPAALDDTVGAYRWLLSNGVRSECALFIGDSAGGNLALSALLKLRDAAVPLPAGAILMSAVLDFTMSGTSHAINTERDIMENRDVLIEARDMYLGEQERRSPYVSPVFADLQGLPPLLIHVGSDEVLLDDSRLLAERVRQAGGAAQLHVGDGMWHVWHAMAVRQDFPEGRLALDQIREFARRHVCSD